MSVDRLGVDASQRGAPDCLSRASLRRLSGMDHILRLSG